MDLNRLLSARKARLGTLSGAGVLVLAAALSLVNLISQKVFVRLDWTEGGRYSLSKASRRTVRQLPDPVLFRAYVSGGLPQPHLSQARYVEDLLAEYRSAGRGKVKVEIINPEASEQAKADAQRAGVAPVRFTQVASDQFQVREGFLGLAIFYQDKQESIPFVRDTEGLEYELTSRVRKMSQARKKVVGLVSGHGEPSPESLRDGAGAKLFDSFDVRPVVLGAPPPEALDALFVVNPVVAFSTADVNALDAFVSSGVPTAFFLGRRTLNVRSFNSFPRPTGLDDFLSHYGVRLGEDFVLDPQCQQVSMQSSQGGYTVSNIISYPAFIMSRPNGRHPATQFLEVLSFPFVHPVIPTASTGIVVTPLAASSPGSWMPADLPSVDPYSLRPAAPEDARGPFVLAALAEGSVPSFRDPARTAKARLAVVGTGHFLSADFPLAPGNTDFPAFLAEWMTADGDFLSIPPRGAPFRPLRPLPGPVRAALKALAGFFLPVAVVLWGLGRWRRRRARRPVVQKEWEAAARA